MGTRTELFCVEESGEKVPRLLEALCEEGRLPSCGEHRREAVRQGECGLMEHRHGSGTTQPP